MLRTFLPLLAFAPFTAFAQPQLNNPSFENWQNLGTGTEEPTEWSSIKTSDGGALINGVAPQVCFRSADFHTGSYSVNVRSQQAPGVVANGTATCGRVHATFTPSEGSVFTDAGNTDWNHALTSKPDSLVGWFRRRPKATITARWKPFCTLVRAVFPRTAPRRIGTLVRAGSLPRPR
ncbi:MAG: hypothetical protein IPI07_10975 [Flavobacteriales bacterium]|nr:hypothetical protein [Flavobacteriales bacterium]